MQTFLSFQWDILLLEIGFLAIFSTSFYILNNHKNCTRTSIVQCFRFLSWKLMFCSGVVKLQATCLTWESLSALEYHFATQCIPTPLAWYAHQLPPILLRIGVAITLLIEIPLTFLLLSPALTIRRFGVVCQWLLQALIILTGNYTFFNILTIALMLPAWMDEHCPRKWLPSNNTSKGEEGPVELTVSYLQALNQSKWAHFLQLLYCIVFCVFSFLWMFDVKSGFLQGERWWDGSTIAVKGDLWQSSLHPILQACMAGALVFSLSSTFLHIFVDMMRTRREANTVLLFPIHLLVDAVWGCVAIVWLFLAAKPLHSLAPMKPFIPAILYGIDEKALGMWHLTSGYGLFRRMTGVGPDKDGLSVVARPEIVLEGMRTREEGGDGLWREIPFRHKPTSLSQTPSLVAPHQPRLDWQMWFAALGSYQNNPWLLNLIVHLLHPAPADSSSKGSYWSPPVLDLLDAEKYPFNSTSPPTFIRATLFEYDLTRWELPWSRHLQGAKASPSPLPRDGEWWWRRNPKEYLPPLSLHPDHMNQLKQFLTHHGITLRPYVNPLGQVRKCLKWKGQERSLVWTPKGQLRNLVCSVLLHHEKVIRSFTTPRKAFQSWGVGWIDPVAVVALAIPAFLLALNVRKSRKP